MASRRPPDAPEGGGCVVTLERLELKNFQAHESITVEFDPLITTVIGPTDAGKSSVLRALRWVALNQPNGIGFIRDDAAAAEATLYVDGRRIVRKRGRVTENSYTLDDAPFYAFGQSVVPDPIAQVLAVSPVNFAGQHDPHFLIAASAPEVARSLNAVVDLGVIDQTYESIGRTVRKAKDDAEAAHARLIASRDRAAALEWIQEAEPELKVVEDAYQARDDVQKYAGSLDNLIGMITHDQGERDVNRQVFEDAAAVGKQAADCLDQERVRDNLASIIMDVKTLTDAAGFAGIETTRLDTAFQRYYDLKDERTRLDGMLAEIRKLRTAAERGAADFGPVAAAYEAAEAMRTDKGKLERLIQSAGFSKDDAETRRGTEAAAQKILVDAEKAAGRCPLCGSELHNAC